MLVHLRNGRGIDKVVEDLKKLDPSAKIKNHESFISIESDVMRVFVRYNYSTEKVEMLFWLWNDYSKDLSVPIRFCDCVLIS